MMHVRQTPDDLEEDRGTEFPRELELIGPVPEPVLEPVQAHGVVQLRDEDHVAFVHVVSVVRLVEEEQLSHVRMTDPVISFHLSNIIVHFLKQTKDATRFRLRHYHKLDIVPTSLLVGSMETVQPSKKDQYFCFDMNWPMIPFRQI